MNFLQLYQMDSLSQPHQSDVESLGTIAEMDDFMFDGEVLPVSFENTAVTSTITAMQVPRMVSVDSMTQLRAAPLKKQTNSTPYDSLKSLVQTKRSQKRSHGEVEMLKIVPAEPSEYTLLSPYPSISLLDAALPKIESQGPSKKRKIDPDHLHKACQKGVASLISEALQEDPTAASRPVQVSVTRPVYDPISRQTTMKVTNERYTYPINIAINYKAETHVINQLIDADSSVLARKDGSQQETSLHIILKDRMVDIKAVDAMLLKAPKCVMALDRHNNTALHIAVRSGVPLDVIRHLCILYPEAVLQRNFHGQTPLDLAQRCTNACSDEVASFLLEKFREIQ